MKKIEKAVYIIIALLIVAGIWLKSSSINVVVPNQIDETKLGNLFIESHAYKAPLTCSTSSVSNDVATLLLPSATTSRTRAEICFVPGGGATLWLLGTSTGATVNMGHPIYASTTESNYDEFDVCKLVDSDDPYLGQFWGITTATATVSVCSKQE